MKCKDCEKKSVRGDYCPYAEGIYNKECAIEDVEKTPDWCPLLREEKRDEFTAN